MEYTEKELQEAYDRQFSSCENNWEHTVKKYNNSKMPDHLSDYEKIMLKMMTELIDRKKSFEIDYKNMFRLYNKMLTENEMVQKRYSKYREEGLEPVCLANHIMGCIENLINENKQLKEQIAK